LTDRVWPYRAPVRLRRPVSPPLEAYAGLLGEVSGAKSLLTLISPSEASDGR